LSGIFDKLVIFEALPVNCGIVMELTHSLALAFMIDVNFNLSKVILQLLRVPAISFVTVWVVELDSDVRLLLLFLAFWFDRKNVSIIGGSERRILMQQLVLHKGWFLDLNTSFFLSLIPLCSLLTTSWSFV